MDITHNTGEKNEWKRKGGGRWGEGGREGKIMGKGREGGQREKQEGEGKRKNEQRLQGQHIVLVAPVASLFLLSPASCFNFCGSKDETQGFTLHTSGAFRLSHPHPKVVIFCLRSHAP